MNTSLYQLSVPIFLKGLGNLSQIIYKAQDYSRQNNIDELHLCAQQYELMGDFALGFAELIEIVALNSGLYTDEGWDE